MAIIQLSHVSKSFELHTARARSFQELIVNRFSKRRQQETSSERMFWAMHDVSFAVDKGETLGIVGSNGSGKSTCLKLLTRILEPTSGIVRVDGRVSALLELGAGFHPELTGRENVFLNGSVLGLSRREMSARMEEIIRFAELERFIDMPVKFYSSGMYVRLAFAIAINVNPDLLLVDEVLAVGDQVFQEKCLERIHALKSRGVTIVFVSHSLDAVKSLCERAIWLDQGELKADGPTDVVAAQYLQFVHEKEEAEALAERASEREALAEADSSADSEESTLDAPESPVDESDPMAQYRNRWGSHEAEITDVVLRDRDGRERLSLTTGEPVTIAMHYRARQYIEHPMFGLAIHRADGLQINGPNNLQADFDIDAIEGQGQVNYHIDSLPLLEGSYYLTVALYDQGGTHAYDHQALQYKFRVHNGSIGERYGAFYIPAIWSHEPGQPTSDGDAE